MDKNRNVPIDEFFSDLRHYEAAGPSGSAPWEKMRRLLDRKLPEGRPLTRTVFRKWYLLPFLLLFVGGGAYLIAHRYPTLRSGAGEAPPTAIVSSDNRPAGTALSGTSGRQQSGTAGSTAPDALRPGATTADAGQPAADRQGEQSKLNSAQQASRQALAYAEKAEAGLAAAANRPEALASAGHPDPSVNRHRGTGDPAGAFAPAHKPVHRGIARGTDASAAAAGEARDLSRANAPVDTPAAGRGTAAVSDQAGEASAPTATPDVQVLTERTLIEQIYPREDRLASSPGESDPRPETAGGDADNDWIPIPAASGEEIVQSRKKGMYFRVNRDTFKRIEKQLTTVEDPRDRSRRDFKIDTLSITRVEQVTYHPISYPAPVFSEREYGTASVTAGSKTAVPTTMELVPLSSYKVASKKIKPSAFASLKKTANGLEALFDGEKDWYMAVFAGGHASLGNPGSLGIQAGIAALYTFRERWVVAAEARFMKTYFPGYKLLDAASNFELDKSPVPGGWLFSGTKTVTTNAYNLQWVNSLHVPVTLSYNFGRLSAFGGLDLSYSFPLQWAKETSFSSLPVSGLSADGRSPFIDQSFDLDVHEAFKSRFGLGYLAGLSYDFSRKLSLDLRLRQTLWDNGRYEMENLKKLYRRPSAELTLGFFFGQREKVIYIMDTHR